MCIMAQTPQTYMSQHKHQTYFDLAQTLTPRGTFAGGKRSSPFLAPKIPQG